MLAPSADVAQTENGNMVLRGTDAPHRPPKPPTMPSRRLRPRRPAILRWARLDSTWKDAPPHETIDPA